MNDERKPCPFCGSDSNHVSKRTVVSVNFEHAEHAVTCNNCGACGPNEMSKERAVEMWNLRRPADQQAAEAVESANREQSYLLNWNHCRNELTQLRHWLQHIETMTGEHDTPLAHSIHNVAQAALETPK